MARPTASHTSIRSCSPTTTARAHRLPLTIGRAVELVSVLCDARPTASHSSIRSCSQTTTARVHHLPLTIGRALELVSLQCDARPTAPSLSNSARACQHPRHERTACLLQSVGPWNLYLCCVMLDLPLPTLQSARADDVRPARSTFSHRTLPVIPCLCTNSPTKRQNHTF